MLTSLVQARSLYEFFYNKRSQGDDARAYHCAPSWNEPKSHLYLKYMASEKPANKRVFHLVHNRAIHSGGVGDDHLKVQALNFAKDLRKLTEKFIVCVEPDFRDSAHYALNKALNEAAHEADHYGIDNPFASP